MSIDNIVIDYSVASVETRQKILDTISNLEIRYAVRVIHWSSFKPGTFRDQFSIRMESGTSFWVGVALNGSSVSWNRCRLEANPNKVGTEPVFWEMLRYLNRITREVTRRVRRFDLAIDLPVPRDKCFLVKDRRLYLERRHGQEYTQYLGSKSSKVGRVKLYNKSAESKLSNPLTRLELTLDPQIPYAKLNFPTVFCLDDTKHYLDEQRITDTECFILNALLQGFGTLNDLGRKTRAKMERVMTTFLRKVEVAPDDYEAVLAQLQLYVDDV